MQSSKVTKRTKKEVKRILDLVYKATVRRSNEIKLGINVD